MAGELRSTCRTCAGSGSIEADTPITVLTIAEANRPQQACRSCDGTGASIGVGATMEDYLNYFEEPCTIVEEIFSLAQKIQQSQGPLDQRRMIQLIRFQNRRWIPQNPGTYYENSVYVAVLLPDGNFAIQKCLTAEFENPALQIWGVKEEDTGWYSLKLHSLSDLLALFDFSVSLHSDPNVEIDFQNIAPGKWKAEGWKSHPNWEIKRYYEKGFGLLEKLRNIYQDIQQGKNPPIFAPEEQSLAPGKPSPVGSPVKNQISESRPSDDKSNSRPQWRVGAIITYVIYIATVAGIAGLSTFLIFVGAYYSSHFLTHMWTVPWGSAEAIQFAASSAQLFEYSLGTAALWGIASGVFLRIPWIPLMATIHAVQSGIAWPMVLLLPPLLPVPRWISTVLETVTVDVNEWLFFTSILVVPVCLLMVIYTEVFREDHGG